MSKLKVSQKTEMTCAGLMLMASAFFVAPLFLSRIDPAELNLVQSTSNISMIVALLIPVMTATLVLFYHGELRSRQRLCQVVFVLSMSLVMVDLHYSNVDLAQYFAHIPENVEWQRNLHEMVLRSDPAALPHAFRFLPNGIVYWISLLTSNYLIAALIYRLTFSILLLDMIYRYARLFVGYSSALMAVLFYVAVYPISLRFYAGQLTDPASHLSFVMAFYFLERSCSLLLATTIVVGVFAKESILLMPIYWLFAARYDRTVRVMAGATLIGAGLTAVLVRFYVCGGSEQFVVNDIGPSNIVTNLSDVWAWSRNCWNTWGLMIPFLILGWRTTPTSLRSLIVFLLPTLVASSLFYSFLKESRNFMPAVVPLAVATAHYISTIADIDAKDPIQLQN